MPADPLSDAQVDAIMAAVRDAAAAPPKLLVDLTGLEQMLSASRTAVYRIRSLPGFPAAVDVPGIGKRYRVSDIETFVAGMRSSKRRKSK